MGSRGRRAGGPEGSERGRDESIFQGHPGTEGPVGPSRGCSAQTGLPALIFAGKTDLLFQASVFKSVSGDNYTPRHRPVLRINYLKLLVQP